MHFAGSLQRYTYALHHFRRNQVSLKRQLCLQNECFFVNHWKRISRNESFLFPEAILDHLILLGSTKQALDLVDILPELFLISPRKSTMRVVLTKLSLTVWGE